MNYKEKYENALEGIQEILSSGQDSIKMSRLKLRLQGIFPELAESEDEKIRKGIIRCVKGSMPDNDFRKKYLAWLEKQGEKECVLKSSKDKDVHKFMKYIEKQAKAYEFNLPNRSYDIYAFAKDILTWLEKQKPTISWHKVEPKEYVLEKSLILKKNGEIDVVQDTILSVTDAEYVIPFSLLKNLPKSDSQEKNLINDTDEEIVKVVENTSILDMVEPKFKVGDCIKFKELDIFLDVIDIENDRYKVELFNGRRWYYHIEFIDKLCNLWSINDAKDGDVFVASDKSIFIFKEAIGSVCKHYIALAVDGTLLVNDNLKGSWETVSGVKPATKEQRDLLFSKMKEAGYEWDAEKKKLGKRVIDEGKAEMDYCFTKMMNDEQVSSVWSEDDEIEFNHILKTLTSVAKEQEIKGYNNLTSSINWLKSLKDRVQPQPKQEWSEKDEEIISFLNALCIDAQNPNNCASYSMYYKEVEKAKDWLKSLNPNKKPVAKKEPKFKVGDWIVCEVTGSVYQIKNCIENLSNHKYGYDLTNGCYIGCDEANHYHLWTIQDAKDGDVLATEDKNFTTPFVAIYKSLGDTVYDNITFDSHCFIGFNGNFYEGEDGHAIEDAHPATKEQCDLLFQKMHEAGYEWYADKKELLDYKLLINESEVLQNEINWLKSLKPQNRWKPSDEQMRSLSNAINVLHDLRENTDYGFLVSLYNDLKTLKEAGYEWDAENKKLKKEEVDNLHNYLYGEQNPAWSEDDISNIDHLLNALCGVTELKQLQIDKLIIWLKSLKGRVQPNQWKPSDEQLKYVREQSERNDYTGYVMTNLYYDLKKLKEE